MIACLGWGSLIWRRGTLPVDDWRHDGPLVRVEFVRQSQDGRLTLVLHDAEPKQSLWANMKEDSLGAAVTALATRERCPEKRIGRWPTGDDSPRHICNLGTWASRRDIHAVVWTALGPRFQGEDDRAPTEDEAVAYLRKLSDEGRGANAEEYVRRAPPQVDTAYRTRFERCFGWTPQA